MYFCFHLVASTKDQPTPMILASTGGTHISLRLPAGDSNTSELYLVAHIRDILDCVTEFQMGFVLVYQERSEIYALIDGLYAGSGTINDTNENDTEDIRERLMGPDLNTQGQTFTSYSILLNEIGDESVKWRFKVCFLIFEIYSTGLFLL